MTWTGCKDRRPDKPKPTPPAQSKAGEAAS
jgi:hypothetical protein